MFDRFIFNSELIFLPRKAQGIARYCHGTLYIRPYVTLVDCDDMRQNSSKIISRMISSGTWLTADRSPQHHGCTPKGTPQILSGVVGHVAGLQF